MLKLTKWTIEERHTVYVTQPKPMSVELENINERVHNIDVQLE